MKVIKKKCNEIERERKKRKNHHEGTGETWCTLMKCTMSHVQVDVEDTAMRHATVKVYLQGESWVYVTRTPWGKKKSEAKRRKKSPRPNKMKVKVT